MSLEVSTSSLHLDLGATLNNLNGDNELLQAIANIFVEDVPAIVRGLKQSFANGDCNGVVHHAHTIKGMASTFHAEPLTRLSRKLEMEDAKLSACEREELVLEIESLCSETIAELKKAIGF